MSILCYHAIDPLWHSALSVTPDVFRRQCEWLRHNRRVLPLAEAVGRVRPSGRIPDRVAAMTFDDGLASLHQHALPILAENDIPATVFLVAGTLAPTAQPVNWIDGISDKTLRALDLDEILEMKAGHIEFGSHSYAHRDMTRLTEAECIQDFRNSKQLIEDLLKQPVRFLAYPRGLHSDHVRRGAKRAGYKYAFGTARLGRNSSPWGIPRMGVYSGDGSLGFRLKTSTLYPAARTSRTFLLGKRLSE